MRIVFIVLSIWFLASCTESQEIHLEPQVTLYFSDENRKPLSLTAVDMEYTVLNNWLAKNNADWYSTSGRYPGGVYLKSGTNGIQVTETHVILYSTSLPEPKALFIQKIEPHELQGFRKLLSQ